MTEQPRYETENIQNKTEFISSQEELLVAVEETKEAGRVSLIGADFDGTLDAPGPSRYSNPFDTSVHPLCRKGFERISKAGGFVYVASNRAAEQVYKQFHGLENLIIRGTYGYESFSNGISKVESTFYPYVQPINVHIDTVNDYVGSIARDSLVGGVEEVVETKYGPIYIERKAAGAVVSPPESMAGDVLQLQALAYRLNLNDMSPANRVKLIAEIRDIKQQLDRNMDPDELAALEMYWGMGMSNNFPEVEGKFSVDFEPRSTIRLGKAAAVESIYQEVVDAGVPVGLIYYSGDNDADAGGFKAAQAISERSGGEIKAVGVQVETDSSQKVVQSERNFSVRRQKHHGKLLNRVADILEAK